MGPTAGAHQGVGRVLTGDVPTRDRDRAPGPDGTERVGDWVGRLPDGDSPTTRKHRVHQGLWRSNHAGWPAGPPQNDPRVRRRYPTLPNWLAESHDGQQVQDAGVNLMSPEARAYARERLLVLSRIDGKAEEDRLWRNLLSSQPLAFSIAGHLRRHESSAVAVLAALTKLPVRSLARLDPGPGMWQDYRLDGIEAEWFPPRAEHTGDMSGCDIATGLALDDGRRVLVTIEVKYTDSFSPRPVEWARYQKHLTSLGLDEDATSALVEAGCSQVLRQVMVTESVRRAGLAPGLGADSQVDAGLAVVLAREDDRRARAVVEALDEAVGTRIPVQFWSHRQLLEEAATIEALGEWAREMSLRYLPTEE